MKLQWNDATATVESDDIPSWIREERKRRKIWMICQLAVMCCLHAFAASSRKNGNETRRENICDKKAPKQWKSCIHRRLFGPKSHRIHLFPQVNPQFYLFMHGNWKFLSSTTLLYFFSFSSFFGNFSKVFCEVFPIARLLCRLMIGSSVCAQARSPRHMSRLWLRSVQRAAQSSPMLARGIRMSETFNF